MNYIPKPIDLSDITLSEELQADAELIAKNIHEVWAYNRMQQGWGYGDVLNETRKQHPCMVEYEALPEVEKDVDRATVTQTIKMLHHLGYRLVK